MTTLVCLLTAAGSVCLPSGHAGATAHLIPKDSIIIQKQIINKKHLIHLYTNASQQVLFFSVDGEEGKNYLGLARPGIDQVQRDTPEHRLGLGRASSASRLST